jgi:predicted nucleic acid-binding protein
MSAFVLDTSIALKWFLEDEDDRSYSLSILESIADEYRPVVPLLWYYEIASTLLIQVRRKRVEFEKILIYLDIIDEMLIDIDAPDSSAILQLPHLAQTYGLTGYDAAFLELAKRLEVPLATADKPLMKAAEEYGVDLLQHPRVDVDGKRSPTEEKQNKE